MSKKRTEPAGVSAAHLAAFARRFPENGMKLLLENPANVRDLLALSSCDLVRLIDFAGMERVATTFVQRDYRHVECDVVLTAPIKSPGTRRTARTVLVY